RERLALFQCNGGAGFHGSFPPRHLGWHALRWRTHGKRSPQGAKSRGRCSGGGEKSRKKRPTGTRMGCGPPANANSQVEKKLQVSKDEKKLQVSKEKHYTKKPD